MAEWVRTNDGRPLKTIDAALDYIGIQRDRIVTLELALAAERVAHRLTNKELAEVTGMVLR